MKKLVGVTVAAVLTLGGGIAFADGDEGFKSNITLRTGLLSNLTEKETYGVWSDGDFTRTDIILKWTGTDYGLYTNFRIQSTPSTALYNQKVTATRKDDNYEAKVGLKAFGEEAWTREAYGWANLFGGNAKISGGLLVSTDYQDDYWGDSTKEGTGLRLEVTPKAVEGLNFGAIFIAHDDDKTSGDDSSTVNWDKKHWKAGANYEKDLFTARIGYDGGKKNDTEFAWAQFTMNKFPGLEALSAGVSGTIYNLVALESEERDVVACLNIEFDVGKLAESIPLTVGVFGYDDFTLKGSKQKDANEKDYQTFEIDGYATYTFLEKYSVTAEGAYWHTTDKKALSVEEDSQWFGKVKFVYKPVKKTQIGLSYSHKSLQYADNGYGGWLLVASGAGVGLAGYDFVGLDFRCQY